MKKIYSFIIIAMAALVSAPVFTSCTDDNGQEQTGEVDTTELETALEECQALLDDATTTDYPEEAITNFQETVDAVNEALAAGGLTQTVVNNLLANLNAARDTFEASAYGAIPDENLLLSFDFDTEGNTQVSTGTLAYEAELTAGPSEIYGSDTALPEFVEGINGGHAISLSNGSHLEIANWNQSELLKSDVSVSVWVNPSVMVEGNYVFAINYWNTLKINIPSHGRPCLTINTTEGGADMDNSVPESVKPDTWTHLVMTVSLTDNVVNMYVNGELTKTFTDADYPAIGGASFSTYTPAAGGQLPIMIGTTTTYEEAATWTWTWSQTPEYWNASVAYNGLIDNLKVYDIALTDGQVSKLYSDELGE